jgi:hypothetical protein
VAQLCALREHTSVRGVGFAGHARLIYYWHLPRWAAERAVGPRKEFYSRALQSVLAAQSCLNAITMCPGCPCPSTANTCRQRCHAINTAYSNAMTTLDRPDTLPPIDTTPHEKEMEDFLNAAGALSDTFISLDPEVLVFFSICSRFPRFSLNSQQARWELLRGIAGSVLRVTAGRDPGASCLTLNLAPEKKGLFLVRERSHMATTHGISATNPDMQIECSVDMLAQLEAKLFGSESTTLLLSRYDMASLLIALSHSPTTS